MERERFEAIASGRSSIQSVPRSEGKSGLRAGGQARQLGGRCYSGKLLPKNQTGYRREADRCHLRAEHGLAELETGANQRTLCLFSFSPPKDRDALKIRGRKNVSLDREARGRRWPSISPSQLRFPGYRSAGRLQLFALRESREGELRRSIFRRTKRTGARKSAEGREKIYMEAATGSLCTPPPSSCFLFSFLLERERERGKSREPVSRDRFYRCWKITGYRRGD